MKDEPQLQPATPESKAASSRHSDVTPPSRRPWALRLAKYVRHFEFASGVVGRADALMAALLMVKRPRWVDAVVLGLRGTAALGDTIDLRIHREINRNGRPLWPCYHVMYHGLFDHWKGTWFKDMPWFTVPIADGRKIDVVLSTSNSVVMWVDGDEATRDAVTTEAWRTWAPVCEIRGSGEHDLAASAGEPLLVGHPRDVAATIAAEFVSGERSAVLFLGKPGTGKSYAAEQVAAAVAARRSADLARPVRVMRLPAFNKLSLEPLLGLMRTLRPDVVIVHDIDTDAATAAILLRFTESCETLGVALVCTANEVDKMHAAALRDGRLGAPIPIDVAPESLVRAVLSDECVQRLTDNDAEHGASTWTQVKTWPLSAVARLRRSLAAGKPVAEALASTASKLDAPAA